MFKNILFYFDTQGWKYQVPEPTKTLALLGIGSQNGQYPCMAEVQEDLYRFVFFSICPVQVPMSKRKAMAELITRMNHHLFLGNFELDFDDGEVRFKTSVVYESVELTVTLIDHLVKSNLAAMNKNIEILSTFALGRLSLKDAMLQLK
jgi:hypothetical protein